MFLRIGPRKGLQNNRDELKINIKEQKNKSLVDRQPTQEENSLNYLILFARSYQVFSTVKSHKEYEEAIGKKVIKDISNSDQYFLLESIQPMPSGFHNRLYEFFESANRKGYLEVTIKNCRVVNIRAQLFFNNILGKFIARRYFRTKLLPFFIAIFRQIPSYDNGIYWAKSFGVVGGVRYVNRTNWVSFYLINEEYAEDLF